MFLHLNPRIVAILAMPCAAMVHAAQSVDDEYLIYTAARLPQSAHETPSAVTIIDQELIRLSGARKIADLMRLVPGMVVGSKLGNLQSVAYHGMTDEYSRRMQVLIDGRSIYSPAMGGVYWLDLPVPLEDIVRIEIIRGPNTVSYGSNAFLATINIITRPARESTGGRISVLIGNHGERDVHAGYGFMTGRLAGQLSVLSQQDDGYTTLDHFVSDGRNLKAFNSKFELDAGQDDDLSLAVGLSSADKGIGGDAREIGLADGGPMRETIGENDYQYLQWRHRYDARSSGVLRLSRTRDMQNDDGYALAVPSLASPLLIRDGYDSQRLDAEYEHTMLWSSTLRTALGASVREDRITSQSFLGTNEPQSNTIRRAFANAEWRASDVLTLHAGGMVESSSFNDSEFSPRLAAVWTLAQEHTLRLGYSEGRRTPFFYERQGVKSYSTEDGSVSVYSVMASSLLNGGQGLATEHARSMEIGYQYRPFRHAHIDLRLYRDRLSNMIKPILRPEYGVLTSMPGLVGDFETLGEVHVHGVELQSSLKLGDGWRIHANYAWTHIDEQSLIAQIGDKSYDYDSSAPEHSGSLLVGKQFNDGWEVSGVYSHVGPMRWLWYAYPVLDAQDRLDLRVAKHFSLAGQRMQVEGVAQYLLGDVSDFLPERRWRPGVYLRLTLETR